MEKEYIKELDHTYLVLGDGPIDEDEYNFQMVLRGRLPGVLPLSIAMKDGKQSLRADVTACTNIASRFKNMDLTGHDLRQILSAIRDTALRMPKLLMSAQDLYLDPECIFLGAGADQILLCYVPHLSESEPHSVRTLAEFFLKKIDHADSSAASLAYELFDQVSSDSYILGNILQDLLKGQNQFNTSRSGSQPGTPHAPGSQTPGAANFHAQAGPQASGSAGFHAQAGGPQAPGSGAFRTQAGGPQAPGSASFRAQAGGPQVFKARDTEYEDFPRGNARKVSPSTSRSSRAHSRRHPSSSTGKGRSASSRTRKQSPRAKARRRRKKSLLRRLLPAIVILTCAGAVILYFRMDLTQIAGMGFLCSALIWMIHNSMEKHENERRNIWFDDDDCVSDDRFYQSLRQELYAHEEEGSPSSSPGGSEFDSYRYDSSETLSSGFDNRDPGKYAESYDSRDETDGRTRMLRRDYPSLVSLQKDRCPDIALSREHLILGKSKAKADVILPDNTVSRKHARIERRMDGYYVTDLFSTNGTFIDGHRIESGQAVLLSDGVQLTISSLHYRVTIPQSRADDLYPSQEAV